MKWIELSNGMMYGTGHDGCGIYCRGPGDTIWHTIVQPTRYQLYRWKLPFLRALRRLGVDVYSEVQDFMWFDMPNGEVQSGIRIGPGGESWKSEQYYGD